MATQPQPQNAQAAQWKADKASLPIDSGKIAATDADQFSTYCMMLSRSNAIPECYRNEPGNIMAALILGRDLGVGDGVMLQNSFVQDGRVNPMTYMLLGCVMQSPYFDAKQYKLWTTGKRFEDDYTWYCQAARAGGQPQVFSFSVAMAKRAGLWDKSSKSGKPLPWKLYPDDMGTKMPIARMMRQLFPGESKGLVTHEEMMQQAAVDNAIDSLALDDAALTEHLTTPVAPEPEPQRVEIETAIVGPGETLDVTEPPPPVITTYDRLVALYRGLPPETRETIRKQHSIQSITDTKDWAPEDQTDLLIVLKEHTQ